MVGAGAVVAEGYGTVRAYEEGSVVLKGVAKAGVGAVDLEMLGGELLACFDAVELGVEAPDFEDALLRYDKLLTDMEAALADRQWLLGDVFSLADVSLIPYITRLEALALDRMFEGRPRFSGWFERVKSRASYDQAFTQWLNPYYQKMMRERGLEAWPAAADIIAAS